MTAQREALVALDKRRVWHPYTPMQAYIEQGRPLVIERAEGARLYDLDGRSYIDGNSSWWTAVLGHGHPRLVGALERQARTLCHTALAGIVHENAAVLADELVQVAPPGLDRVFFSDDGSTSVEVALKLSLQFWSQNGRPERRRFIALDGAFHGDTLGATALGGVEVFRRPFASVLLDCVHVPSAADGFERAFAAIEALVERDRDHVAAVVLEPIVQGAAGMRIYDPEFLRRVRELTTRHDLLLVADEVFTGYGRTGPMWACEHAGVAPDLLCLAKGFTGGLLPMAATLVSARVFEGFLGPPERAFYYGHTFCGNPLGAAIAREVLAVFREEQVLEQAARKARRIAAFFEGVRGRPGVRATRALGMIGALDLEGEGGYLDRAGWRVVEAALERGAYLRPLGNVVYVAPPLNIPDADLEELLQIVDAALGCLA
ncbi:MAG TPA: adenosylmethionine--8-amino-7-oxononanoate transaminase [Polyangiaceae bacterium]|nr:adenosylmethionine--8-amino-7-oxononanoate transaminase [Polyangiaceae bacterium]